MRRSFILRDIALCSRLVYANSVRNQQNFSVYLQGLQKYVPRACHFRTFSSFSRYLSSSTISSDGSNSAVERCNDRLTSALNRQDINEVLELFAMSKTEGNTPSAKIYSQAMHLLFSNSEHKQLDKLYKEMRSYGYHVGEGVRMTVIRSYVSRRLWNEVLSLLDDTEAADLMRHTRTFNPIIKGLAEDGHAYDAFELFDKKLKMSHCIANGHENIIHDTEMFVAMIKSSMIDSSQTSGGVTTSKLCKQRSLSTSRTSVLNDGEKASPVLSLTPNCETVFSGHEKAFDHTNDRHSLVFRLYEIFYQFGLKFPPDIIQACKEWSTFDESHLWKWRVSTITKTGKCNLCGANLYENLPNDYFKDLENELIELLNSGQDSKLKLTHEETEELKYVHDLCEKKGPFDVIIDAQNIGLEGRRKGSPSSYSTKIYEKRLISVVQYFSKQKKNIFLPLHAKAMENDISKELLMFLRNHCHVQVLQSSINEDILLLYAAALSGMDCYKTSIVSNDNWRDHSSMLSLHNHWKLLKWGRINHISFTLTNKNKLKFHKNLFDPVLRRSDSGWHFPMSDGRWQCVRLQKK